ncbi:MAG: hypothetical protein R2697_08845 [Ilumatobacteraceae bacterium]
MPHRSRNVSADVTPTTSGSSVPHLLRELRSVRGRRDGADLAITVTGTEIRADLVPNGADGVHRHDDPAWGDAVSSITGGGDASLTITSGSLAPNDLAAARVAGLVVLARQHGVTVSSDGVDAWPHPLRPLGLDLGI